MNVTLLGTGAPAGFPEPGCPCAACARAAAEGAPRAATSVLVDGVLLLDLTPGVVLAAARAGQSTHRVRQVLLTHPHDGPAVESPDELPPPVRVPDGRELTLLSGHRVRAVPLDSPGTGYAVTGPDGERLLYLPPGGAPAGLGEDEPLYDLCLLDVLGRPDALARLRAGGSADWTTDVVAVHIGHTVPPGGELRRRLESAGARAVPDGTALRAGERPDLAERPRRTLVLGAPGAGQWAEAARLLATLPEVLLVSPGAGAHGPGTAADAAAVPGPGTGHGTGVVTGAGGTGPEHRPPGWRSHEAAGPRELVDLLDQDGPPLLVGPLPHRQAAVNAAERFDPALELAAAVRRTRRVLVLAGEEHPALARLNAAVAAECEQVLLVVAGTVWPLRR